MRDKGVNEGGRGVKIMVQVGKRMSMTFSKCCIMDSDS